MFCRIYVTRKDITEVSLINDLSNQLDKQIVDKNYIELSEGFLTVRSNNDYDNEKAKIFPDGFLYFKLIIEIEISENKIGGETIVSNILNYLWRFEYSAIASCSFETSLPENGGYNSLNIPWFN